MEFAHNDVLKSKESSKSKQKEMLMIEENGFPRGRCIW